MNELNIVVENVITANIPSFEPSNFCISKEINGLKGLEFINAINNAYEEVIQWRKNLFKLPTGKSVKFFIRELTVWLEHFNQRSNFHAIALKAYMILPALLLQKPSSNSKAKDHCKKLEERLSMWKNGEITNLIKEGRLIQEHLKLSKRCATEDKAKIFAKLMLQDKINSALKMLSDCDTGVHHMNDEVFASLLEKHPDPSPIAENTLLKFRHC